MLWVYFWIFSKTYLYFFETTRKKTHNNEIVLGNFATNSILRLRKDWLIKLANFFCLLQRSNSLTKGTSGYFSYIVFAKSKCSWANEYIFSILNELMKCSSFSLYWWYMQIDGVLKLWNALNLWLNRNSSQSKSVLGDLMWFCSLKALIDFNKQ